MRGDAMPHSRSTDLGTELTPDDATWNKIAAAGEPITATVVSADLETNRVTQGGERWFHETRDVHRRRLNHPRLKA